MNLVERDWLIPLGFWYLGAQTLLNRDGLIRRNIPTMPSSHVW